jgi:hypothetical protein
MRSTKTGPKTRAMTDTPARSHPGGVTSANIRRTPATGVRAPAMHRRARGTTCGVPAMACCALAMNSVEVLRVRGCVTGAVRSAHEFTKVESVVVRNFTPAVPRLM